MDLSVEIAGIQLKNPVIAASGTYGYGTEFEEFVDLRQLGAIVTKGLSKSPIEGNPAPRLFETAAGMLNSVCLQNMGASEFIRSRLPGLRQKEVVVIANVFGFTQDDYVETIRILNEADGLAAYELNVSCPNTRHGGMSFGTDPECLHDLVSAAKQVSRLPVIVKLSPNVGDIAEFACIAQDAGADALSLVNTFLAMSIDVKTRRPRFRNVVAGLSGPAIKPIAVRMVYQASRAVRIPVIGMGGIACAEDAIEFLLAGARAVEVGTSHFWDPAASSRIVTEIDVYCRNNNIANIRDLSGALIVDPPEAVPDLSNATVKPA